MRNLFTYRLGLLLTFIGLAVNSFAAEEHFFNSKSGRHFAADSSLTVSDDKFGTSLWSTIHKNIKVTDLVTLELNEDTSLFLIGSHTCRADLEITYFTAAGDSDSLSTTLQISYDTVRKKPYNFRSTFKFNGAYKVRARILAVFFDGHASSTFPKVFTLAEDIYINRIYNFDCSFVMQPSDSFGTVNQRLYVSWDPVTGADEYDLEYTFYDDSSAVVKQDMSHSYTDFGFLFNGNATRVTVQEYDYAFSLVYNPGRVFYRIRPIHYDSVGDRIEGTWSSDTSTTLANFDNQYNWKGHENTMNWQYTAAFAEQGKRKEVTSYFDGSLRNRQSVTLNNTQNKAIIGETIYDFQGRPAVTSLPTPIDSGKIVYYDKYNVDPSDSEYNRKDFDTGSCGFIPTGMDSIQPDSLPRGSSSYYSSSNPDKNIGFDAFLPDAQGYPFTMTEYTPDNTGRINRQSIAGKTHRLGSGHETKYFYGKPAQEELDRLFGSEVGYNSHYLKNMVMDANGQLSVSYVDANGKTVATALAGQLPSNMKPIGSYYAATTLKINLLDQDSVHPTNTSILSNYTLLATNAGDYHFAYQLLPGNYTDTSCSSAHVCTDCLYDVQLLITDECSADNPIILHYDSNLTYKQAFDTLCGHQNISDTFTVFLEPGQYNISRLITVDPKAISFYTAEFQRKATCVKSYSSFLTTAIANTDFAGCNMNCSTCLSSLGTESAFLTKYITELHSAGESVSTHQDTLNADTAYNQALAQCNALCNATSPCTTLYDAMLADVSLGGQYCTYTKSGASYTYGDVTSMLHGDYTAPITPYVDGSGKRDSVLISGVKYLPGTLSITQFVENWKPSWASSLVGYHPEYCYYKYCTLDSASNRWDNDVENSGVFRTADSNGYLNPLGRSVCGEYNNVDPYFKKGGLGQVDSTWMRHRLKYYITSGGTTLSLWETVALLVNRGADSLQGLNITTALTSSDTAFCTGCVGNMDFEWNTFKGLYMSLKQEGQDSLENVWVNTSGNCNSGTNISCVGNGSCGSYSSKKPRNINVLNAAQFGDTGPTYPSKTSELRYADSTMTANCDSNCRSYVGYWYKQLSGCGTISSLDSTKIINRMLAVCESGCNVNHPNGASIDKHGVLSSYHDTSFAEIIDSVLGVSDTNSQCNALNISMPPPYNDSIGIVGPTITYYKPDSCVCAQLNTYYTSYYVPDSTYINSHYKNFGGFLSYYFRDTISDSNAMALLNLCNNSSCFYLAKPIEMPIWLSCCGKDIINIGDTNDGFIERPVYDTVNHCCLTCTDVEKAMRMFTLAYPHVTDTGITYQAILANYLDQKFNFNLTFNEYVTFYNECKGDPDSALNLSTVVHPEFLRPTLCNRALNESPETPSADTNTCYSNLMLDAQYNAQNAYNQYMDSVQNTFEANYVKHCMAVDDSFHVTMPFDEYHYTLYYYDQGENLVKTVPPQGVHPITAQASLDSVAAYRAGKAGYNPVYPIDSMLTHYFYNTLNSPIKQQTPDGDSVHFWYDRLGRICLSQNALQRSLLYNYTQYDALGRVIEVGQVSTVPQNLPSCFHCVGCTIDYGVLPVLPDTFSRNDAELQNFINTGTRTQITHTYFDSVTFSTIPLSQQNLRKRVASIIYEDDYNSNIKDYNVAIHYTYDVEGNVESILVDVPHDSAVHQRYKRINYSYDLISGHVNEIIYEQDSIDQFIHNYEYDADNRITDVMTSQDSLYWENDASYQYYDHGPLAREIIGRRQVQGVDFAYTLNGWVKAVNSGINNPSYDMGGDGDVHGSNNTVARDAYGYNLNFFNGDYIPIVPNNSVVNGLPIQSLYNANISGATYSVSELNPNTIGYEYGYDQLNRIVSQLAFKNINVSGNVWLASDSINDFREHSNYDDNGNILSYIRHGNSLVGPTPMDSLTYHYTKGRNQLVQVNDAVPATNYTVDIHNETSGRNYQYNGIGELARDSAGGIDTVIWSIYDKVKKIEKYNGDSIVFFYDPLGERIEKRYYPHSSTADTTMYVRAADKNALAIYDRKRDTVRLIEWDIYGNKRIGTADTLLRIQKPATGVGTMDSLTISYLEGQKQYELSNHLGNIIVTVSDKKIPVDSLTTDTLAKYYLPLVITAQDYYPFGMEQPGRIYLLNGDSAYRFAFNGKEKTNEIYGNADAYDYGKRFYDSRLARPISIDPLAGKFPYLSPYQYFSDNPIRNIDLDGKEGVSGVNGNPGTTKPDGTQTMQQDNAHGNVTAPPLNTKTNSQTTGGKKEVYPAFTSDKRPESVKKQDQAAGYNQHLINEYKKNMDGTFEGGGGAFGMGSSQTIIDAAKQAPLVLLPEEGIFSAGGDISAEIGASIKAAPVFEIDGMQIMGDCAVENPTIINNPGVTVQNISATRVLQGASDKIAVIGRNMGNVEKFAGGVGGETWKGFNLLASTEENLANNTKWAKDLMDKGYTVYDIGLDPDFTSQGDFSKGVYYDMETKVIFGDK